MVRKKNAQYKFYNTGDISFVIVAVIAIGIFITGVFASFRNPNFSEGILINPTSEPAKNTQQLQALHFITVTPIPTIPPITPPPGTSVTPGPTSAATPPPGGGGSLLCGTNLGLFDDNDWINNPGAQASLAKLHVPTLRMSLRVDKDPTGARLVKSVQIAHSLGVIPLVTLPSETTYLSLDINVINKINTIMGGSQIFYELGNEVFDSAYLGKWNTIIPQLKPIAVNAWFGGPVAGSNAHGGTTSMANFYVSAKPTPDFLDWHEYTCGNIIPGTPNYDPKNTANYCFDHVANSLGQAAGQNWTQHMLDTKTALQALGVTTMPKVFITEWGYDSVPLGGNTPDPRLATLVSMHFPTEALKELKNIGVYAAYQYVLNTNKDVNLVNYNGSQITPYGQDFQATCQGM